MSHIAIVGAATGTGTFSIAAPAGSTDRTLTLPDSAGTLATSESVAAAGYTTSAGVLSQFNASGSAPVYACRAWVNFNGQGTVAIRASGNVSSITDNGTGNYTVNFTTAMPDANYAVSVSKGMYANEVVSELHRNVSSCNSQTTTSTRVVCGVNYSGGTYPEDFPVVCASIFR